MIIVTLPSHFFTEPNLTGFFSGSMHVLCGTLILIVLNTKMIVASG